MLSHRRPQVTPNRPHHRRLALVTGAGGGIGAAIVEELFHSGWEIIAHANRSTEKVLTAAAKFGAAGDTMQVVTADLSSVSDIKTLVKQIPPVDALINNAALASETAFLEISDSDFDRMIAVNLKAPFLLSQLVMPHMVDQSWGRIINIASIGGQWGGINQIHYATAKAGLIGLTRSLAKTYGSFGVTVNAVSPGLIATDMAAAEMARPDGVDKVRNIPLGRVGRPEEVAAAVEFLASDAAGYITGQTINLNGGMLFS